MLCIFIGGLQLLLQRCYFVGDGCLLIGGLVLFATVSKAGCLYDMHHLYLYSSYAANGVLELGATQSLQFDCWT